jgi:2-C-methyl-D-erythritol 2,4-cyclodiphosphate synthase
MRQPSALSVPTPRSDGERLFVTSFYDGALMLKLDPDKPAAVFKLDKKLKGDPPYERIPVNMTGNDEAKKAGDTKTVLDRLDPAGPETWTDEAAMLEVCRIAVHAIPGEATNLKVTVPADLGRAEAILGAAGRTRVGFGRDSHPFGPGDPLVLGAISIDAPRLRGHSDGDVVLHAVADALLGAASLGDLGRLFPAGPETPRGIASRELLAEVIDRLEAAGYRPASVDVTVIGARPRLAPRLDEMRRAIAAVVGLPVGAVSVKASTANFEGMTGAGRGLAAEAIAVIETG